MASGLFLCFKALRVVDTPYDLYVLCLLLALEVPAYLNTWRLWRMNRS